MAKNKSAPAKKRVADTFDIFINLANKLGLDQFKKKLFEIDEDVSQEERESIWNGVIDEVRKQFNLKRELFFDHAKYSQGGQAKQTAIMIVIIILHKQLDYPLKDISSFLKYEITGVYKKVAAFEDLKRDNKADMQIFPFEKYDKIIEGLKVKKIIN